MSYYLKVGDVFYFLDATTDINISLRSTLSSHPTEDRKTASDNYVNDAPTCSLSGVISDIKNPTSNSKAKSFSDYIDGLKAARIAKVPITLKYRLDLEEDKGWYITSFDTDQDNTNGYGGGSGTGVVQSAKIRMVLQKVLYSQGVDTLVDIDPLYVDQEQVKKDKSASTSAFDDTDAQKEKEKTVFDKATDAAVLTRKLLNTAVTGNL